MGGTLPCFFYYSGIFFRIQRRLCLRFLRSWGSPHHAPHFHLLPRVPSLAYYWVSFGDEAVTEYGRCYVDIVVVVLLAAAPVLGAHRRWIALVQPSPFALENNCAKMVCAALCYAL